MVTEYVYGGAIMSYDEVSGTLQVVRHNLHISILEPMTFVFKCPIYPDSL